MTVVTAIIENHPEQRVLMTADRNAVAEDFKQHREDLKVFINGMFVMSIPESWRAGQVLRFMKVPQPASKTLLDFNHMFRFMVKKFIPSVIEELLSNGCLSEAAPYDLESEFLAAVGPWLFEIGRDFQVSFPSDGFSAIGNGSEYALAVLKSSKLPPVGRLCLAVETASHFVPGISPDCSPVYSTMTVSQTIIRELASRMRLRQMARRLKRSLRFVSSVAAGNSAFTDEEKNILCELLESES